MFVLNEHVDNIYIWKKVIINQLKVPVFNQGHKYYKYVNIQSQYSVTG